MCKAHPQRATTCHPHKSCTVSCSQPTQAHVLYPPPTPRITHIHTHDIFPMHKQTHLLEPVHVVGCVVPEWHGARVQAEHLTRHLLRAGPRHHVVPARRKTSSRLDLTRLLTAFVTVNCCAASEDKHRAQMNTGVRDKGRGLGCRGMAVACAGVRGGACVCVGGGAATQTRC